MNKSSRDDALEKLRKKGYKLTPQRLAVLDVLLESHGHLTPAELYDRVVCERPETGLVTVYRTLEIFLKLGLVCEIHSTGGGLAYIARVPSGHHHHLICSACGTVLDFVDCDLEDLEQRVSLVTGFEIENHFLELIGRCHDCQEQLSI